jgi:hypothetical protein
VRRRRRLARRDQAALFVGFEPPEAEELVLMYRRITGVIL